MRMPLKDKTGRMRHGRKLSDLARFRLWRNQMIRLCAESHVWVRTQTGNIYGTMQAWREIRKET